MNETHISVGMTQENTPFNDNELDGDVMLAEPQAKTQKPPMFKVTMLNDDYTPMDFVIAVLESIFRKPHEEAIELMMNVHKKGATLVGVYTRDIAETKVDQAVEYARLHEYPLQCTLESE